MTTLIYLGLSWIIGLILARWQAPSPPGLFLAALPVVGGLILYRRSRLARRACLGAGACLLGAGRMWLAVPHLDSGHVAFYNDQGPVYLTGLVVAAPDVRDTYVNLRLAAAELAIDDQTFEVGGLVLVRAPRYPAYNYGEHLAVTAELETPPVFEDFNYRAYLARQGIYTLIRRPNIEVLAPGQGSPFWGALYSLSSRAQRVINRSLAEPYASLLNGILLGIEGGIPRDLYDRFNVTGTSHVIVISGSNVALVAGIFLVLGRRLVGPGYAPPLAMAGILLYTLLVGADAAVSRAAVMGILWMGAIWVGRPSAALNALVASALVLTALNPATLEDVGFQLSFMATLGLILCVPSLETWAADQLGQRLDERGVRLTLSLLKEVLLVTLAATVFTTPIILYHFGRFSLVSLLTNLLILPVQPFIMIFGGLLTLTGLLFLPLAQLLAWLAWLPLAWTVWWVELTARIPYASIEVTRVPLWSVGASYALLGLGLWWRRRPVG